MVEKFEDGDFSLYPIVESGLVPQRFFVYDLYCNFEAALFVEGKFDRAWKSKVERKELL
jgi:hypothetical protein